MNRYYKVEDPLFPLFFVCILHFLLLDDAHVVGSLHHVVH